MILYDISFLESALRDKGVERVSIYRGKELKFLCPLPNCEDRNPSAYLILEKDFFKCFSCGKAMSVRYFLLKMGIKHRLSEKFLKEKKFEGVPAKRVLPKVEAGNYKLGLRYFEEAGDYRLFPPIAKYLEKRLGPGFRLPPFVKIKYHEERDTLLYRGVEELITEKFPPGKKLRFVNYGDGVLMHHMKGKVQDLVEVEGFFDYLKVFQVHKNVCGLMTTSIGGDKAAILDAISLDRVWRMLDNDVAGRSAAKAIDKKLIKLGKRVGAVRYEGGDPAELTREQIYDALTKAGIDVKSPGR